jgi:hypothetical protein
MSFLYALVKLQAKNSRDGGGRSRSLSLRLLPHLHSHSSHTKPATPQDYSAPSAAPSRSTHHLTRSLLHFPLRLINLDDGQLSIKGCEQGQALQDAGVRSATHRRTDSGGSGQASDGDAQGERVEERWCVYFPCMKMGGCYATTGRTVLTLWTCSHQAGFGRSDSGEESGSAGSGKRTGKGSGLVPNGALSLCSIFLLSFSALTFS